MLRRNIKEDKLIQRNCKTKLKYTKKSDCLVGIVVKRKPYNVSHGNVNVFGIFGKVYSKTNNNIILIIL